MSSLEVYQLRRDEAFNKLMELLYHALDQADYIALNEVKGEIVKRYSWLAQRGWPTFWNMDASLCPICGGGLHYVFSWESRLHYTCKECGVHIIQDSWTKELKEA